MARVARATRKRLGEILLEEGLIQEQQLWTALQEQRRTGELLGEALIRLNFATEDDVASTLVVQFGIPYMPVTKYSIKDEMTQIFPPKLLQQYQFVPADKIGNVLVVVAGSLLTPDILSELEALCGMRILIYVGKQSEVRQLIESRFVSSKEAKAEEAKSLSSLGSMLLGD